MGGFLEGLTSLLGGFAAKKQIDADGFDYQQIRDQKRLEREQEAQRFQQANEDWATTATAQAAAGADEGADVGSFVPSQVADAVKRNQIALRAGGKVKEFRSSLASQKAQADLALLASRDAGAMEREKYKGEMRQQLMQQAEEIRANQQMSPREKETKLMQITAQMQLFGAAEAGRNSRFEAGGPVMPVLDPTGNVTGYNRFNRKSGTVEPTNVAPEALGRRAALPAAQQQTLSDATEGLATIASLKKTLSEHPESKDWFGPQAALQYSLASGSAPGPFAVLGEALTSPPSEGQAVAYAQLGRLKNAGIKAITGAQMSQQEVPRLLQELPTEKDRGAVLFAKVAVTEARLNLLDKVLRGQITKEQAIQQINSIGPEAYFQGYKEQGLGAGVLEGGMPSPRSAAEFAALPSKTRYKAPDGSIRVKP